MDVSTWVFVKDMLNAVRPVDVVIVVCDTDSVPGTWIRVGYAGTDDIVVTRPVVIVIERWRDLIKPVIKHPIRGIYMVGNAAIGEEVMNVLESDVEVVDVFERAGVVDQVSDAIIFVLEGVLTEILDNARALVVVDIEDTVVWESDGLEKRRCFKFAANTVGDRVRNWDTKVRCLRRVVLVGNEGVGIAETDDCLCIVKIVSDPSEEECACRRKTHIQFLTLTLINFPVECIKDC